MHRQKLWSSDTWIAWYLTHHAVVALRLVCKVWNEETRVLLKQREVLEQIFRVVDSLNRRGSWTNLTRVSLGTKWLFLPKNQIHVPAPWHIMVAVLGVHNREAFIPPIYVRADQFTALELRFSPSLFPAFEQNAHRFSNIIHFSGVLEPDNSEVDHPLYNQPDVFHMLSMQLPQLRSLHFRIKFFAPCEWQVTGTQPVLSLPLLYTFFFSPYDTIAGYYPERWHLPQLRHLSLMRGALRQSDLITMPHSSQLLSITLAPLSVPSNFSTLFPLITELGLVARMHPWREMPVPPRSHPIRRLVVASPHRQERTKVDGKVNHPLWSLDPLDICRLLKDGPLSPIKEVVFCYARWEDLVENSDVETWRAACLQDLYHGLEQYIQTRVHKTFPPLRELLYRIRNAEMEWLLPGDDPETWESVRQLCIDYGL